ncbi:hypothetical protein I2I11_06955 [Pontibacter sp. 172403-2]|uniref:hypothetical protein n=1 Tax=Pontibacter rufus TaxID=2791028 RepID=UPI0018AFE80F|nr:hypothetical protein [Pontibacter sp. 172403-2]MBF9253024.1 hypothetical protein [Pontibacter sp. 172403-2]
MRNLRQPVHALTTVAALLLLCMVQAPVAMSGTNGTASTQANTSTTSSQVDAAQQTKASVSTGNMPAAKPKTKAITKPREKSILDADVLDSPMSYLRNAFSSEEEDMEAPAHPGPVVVTLKALAASLLSTII